MRVCGKWLLCRSVIDFCKNDIEKYYINTGTWRNVIPATETFEDFGRLKALTKVMIFSPTEDVPGDDEPKR